MLQDSDHDKPGTMTIERKHINKMRGDVATLVENEYYFIKSYQLIGADN